MGGASYWRHRGVLASCWRDYRVRGSPGARHVCVPVCLYGQHCSGVGYWGTRESQPALCHGLYQQLSWAEALGAPTPSQREEQDEAVGVSAPCVAL